MYVYDYTAIAQFQLRTLHAIPSLQSSNSIILWQSSLSNFGWLQLPMCVQGARRSMVLFVHGRGSAIMQGPQKAYPAQTVAEMIAMNGRGYEKVKAVKEWQQLVMKAQPQDRGSEPPLIAVA
jgi:hypothetical protein